jgi:cyclic beta-1,2-glucan synthetase
MIAGAPFFILRNPETGGFWSTAYQPTLRPTKVIELPLLPRALSFTNYKPASKLRRIFGSRRRKSVEVRRLMLTNHSSRTQVIELTSYISNIEFRIMRLPRFSFDELFGDPF